MSDGKARVVNVEHVCLFALFASVWGVLQTKGEQHHERRGSKRSDVEHVCLFVLFADLGGMFCRQKESGTMSKRVANMESKGSNVKHAGSSQPRRRHF